MKKIKLIQTHQAPNTDQKEDHENHSDLFHLQYSLILEIVPRKSWRHSLSDPHLANSLFSQTPACILLQNNSTINPNAPRLFLIDLDKSSDRNDVVIRLPKDPNVPTRGVQVVGSCNGRLCMYDRINCGRFYISNPIIGESLTPPAPSVELDYQFVCGFGFCPTSEVYKVVVITSPSEGTDLGEIKVMTVGTGVWRSIGNCVYHFWYQPYGVYLNGCLHWIFRTGDGSVSICAFDIEHECFKELSLPSGSVKKSVISIGVLGGLLSVCIGFECKIIVWMMKEYGVGESWTKEIVVKENTISGMTENVWFVDSSCVFCASVEDNKEGKVLLLEKSKRHVYTPGKKRLCTT